MLLSTYSKKELLSVLMAFYSVSFVVNWGYIQVNEIRFGYDQEHWLTASNPDGYDKYKKLVHVCGETIDHGAFFGLNAGGMLSQDKVKLQLQTLNNEIEQSDFRIRNFSCSESGHCSVGLVQYGSLQTSSIDRLNNWLSNYDGLIGIRNVDTYVNYEDWNEGNVICAQNSA
jgi:hypothetical protein